MLDLDQNTDNLLKEFSASGIGISVEGNNLKIDSEKVTSWIKKGAKPSETVASLLKKGAE